MPMTPERREELRAEFKEKTGIDVPTYPQLHLDLLVAMQELSSMCEKTQIVDGVDEEDRMVLAKISSMLVMFTTKKTAEMTVNSQDKYGFEIGIDENIKKDLEENIPELEHIWGKFPIVDYEEIMKRVERQVELERRRN